MSASQRTSSSGFIVASKPAVPMPACGTLTTSGDDGSDDPRKKDAASIMSNMCPPSKRHAIADVTDQPRAVAVDDVTLRSSSQPDPKIPQADDQAARSQRHPELRAEAEGRRLRRAACLEADPIAGMEGSVGADVESLVRANDAPAAASAPTSKRVASGTRARTSAMTGT